MQFAVDWDFWCHEEIPYYRGTLAIRHPISFLTLWVFTVGDATLILFSQEMIDDVDCDRLTLTSFSISSAGSWGTSSVFPSSTSLFTSSLPPKLNLNDMAPLVVKSLHQRTILSSSRTRRTTTRRVPISKWHSLAQLDVEISTTQLADMCSIYRATASSGHSQNTLSTLYT